MKAARPVRRGADGKGLSGDTTCMKQAGLRNSRYLASRLLYLLDGRRSVATVARLTQRSELDVASILARFLHWGYIEPVHTVESRQ